MADLAALQTELETLGRLAAGLEQNRVAVGVAAELFHRRLLDGRTTIGAGATAGGAEALQAGGAGLQQTQEQQGALAPQARHQQVETRVSRCSSSMMGSDHRALGLTPLAAPAVHGRM